MKLSIKIFLAAMCLLTFGAASFSNWTAKAIDIPRFFRNIFGKGIRSEMEQDNEIAERDAIAEALISALSTGDKEAFSALFASNVSSREDFDAQVDALFQYCSGEVMSYIVSGGFSSSGLYQEGEFLFYWHSSLRMTTIKGKFRMSFMYCSRNDADPSYVGLRAITIILDEKVEEEFTFWGNEEMDSGIRILENMEDRKR